MKLLIVTQVVDTEHPILGFFHRWIIEFAKHCEHVHVICLQAGTHELPPNVTVHSLGKERGAGRLAYLRRFFSLIWKLRHEYDSVFVHMNQIYVILGGVLWRLLGKRIGLWYMHGSVPFSLRIATLLTHKIFTGSPESFRLKSNKLMVTGHGIDTEHFKPLMHTEKPYDLITVGRIAASKNIETLISMVTDMSPRPTLAIVGGAVTEAENAYEKQLRAQVHAAHLEAQVYFLGKVPQVQLPQVLNSARVFVTAAQNGSLDKAVLEALACGLPVVSMAPGTESLNLTKGQVNNKQEFVNMVTDYLSSNYDPAHSTGIFKSAHGLQQLVPKIILNLNG